MYPVSPKGVAPTMTDAENLLKEPINWVVSFNKDKVDEVGVNNYIIKTVTVGSVG